MYAIVIFLHSSAIADVNSGVEGLLVLFLLPTYRGIIDLREVMFEKHQKM